MISFNYLGLIVFVASIIPYVVLAFFPPKNRVLKTRSHKQMGIVQFISRSGILFFGFINVKEFGYHFVNTGFEITWVIGFFFFIIFNYICYLRYLFKGRHKEDLYNRFVIPLPIYVSECMLYLLCGIVLVNYFVLFFSIFYFISTIYLNFYKKKEV